MLTASERTVTLPLQPGWLPESGLDWLEEFRVEHERRIALRDRLATAHDGLEGHWAAVQVDYRAAVRAALDAGEPIPALPDELQPEQQRIVHEESAAALADATEAVPEFLRETVATLIERAGELEAAGDALRPFWELVSEPARVGEERAALIRAQDEARSAGEALAAQFTAEDDEDRIATARLARGDWLPDGHRPNEVVHEVRRGDESIVTRRDARRVAQERFDEARDALAAFDEMHSWWKWPLRRFASPTVMSTWLGGYDETRPG